MGGSVLSPEKVRTGRHSAPSLLHWEQLVSSDPGNFLGSIFSISVQVLFTWHPFRVHQVPGRSVPGHRFIDGTATSSGRPGVYHPTGCPLEGRLDPRPLQWGEHPAAGAPLPGRVGCRGESPRTSLRVGLSPRHINYRFTGPPRGGAPPQFDNPGGAPIPGGRQVGRNSRHHAVRSSPHGAPDGLGPNSARGCRIPLLFSNRDSTAFPKCGFVTTPLQGDGPAFR